MRLAGPGAVLTIFTATDLLSSIQRFELLAFFSGYPVIYTVVTIVSGFGLKGVSAKLQKVPNLLGAAYAMVGTIFLFFLFWPAFHVQPFRVANGSIVALRVWAMLAVLFWLPRLRKLPISSLLHSLIFFGLIVLDIIAGGSSLSGRDQIGNDMRLFTISLLLNAATFSIVLLIVFIRGIIRNAKTRRSV